MTSLNVILTSQMFSTLPTEDISGLAHTDLISIAKDGIQSNSTFKTKSKQTEFVSTLKIKTADAVKSNSERSYYLGLFILQAKGMLATQMTVMIQMLAPGLELLVRTRLVGQ